MSVPHLNRKLVLEAPARVSDQAGGYVQDWSQLGVLWAEVKPGTGREAAASAVTVSRVPYRITVRGAPVGSPARPIAGQRFVEGTRIFHVNAVTERDPQARYLTRHAEEETAS